MVKKNGCYECDDFGKGNLYDRIYLENLKERRIILNDSVDESLFETIVMQIRKFNFEDADKPVEDRKPIELYVNSYGGSVYDGFAIVNAIISSKTPVHTICDGYVMSMGLAIFVAGHKRIAYPFTNFMYHEISTMAMGKNNDIERVTRENKRLQKMYDGLMTSRTDLKKSKLDAVKKKSFDWFFGVEEALENGVVHELIK
jgi:ATP-dependent Clp protease, protease subunit